MDFHVPILLLLELSTRLNQRMSNYKELIKLLSMGVPLAGITCSLDSEDFTCFQNMKCIILARKCKLESKYKDLHDLIESLNQKNKLYLFCRCKSNLSKLKLKLSDFNDSERHLEILYAISYLRNEECALLAANEVGGTVKDSHVSGKNKEFS